MCDDPFGAPGVRAVEGNRSRGEMIEDQRPGARCSVPYWGAESASHARPRTWNAVSEIKAKSTGPLWRHHTSRVSVMGKEERGGVRGQTNIHGTKLRTRLLYQARYSRQTPDDGPESGGTIPIDWVSSQPRWDSGTGDHTYGRILGPLYVSNSWYGSAASHSAVWRSL